MVYVLGYQDSNLEMLESESSALPFGDSAIYYKKYLIIEARDGIRTRDPRLGKAMLYHWATSAWILLVEEGGFEPPKHKVTDLQSVPFGHSGTPP